MKHTIYLFAVVSAFVMACSAPADPSLEKLISKRDSLKTVYDSIGKAIAEVEKLIAAKDTTLKPPMVGLMQVTRNDFNSYFAVQGSVNCDKNAQVLPEFPGVVRAIYVREGDRVSQGQKLIQIDDELIREQLQQAEINLSLAKDLFAKQEALWNQKIGSEVQYLQAKNAKENAEKGVELIKSQLSKTVVTAPFTGTVDQVNVKIGEMASQMAPLLRIVDLSNMYIKADVSEAYLPQVKSGGVVTVMFPNMDTLTSSIRRVGNVIKPENRTFEVTVDLPSSEWLKPNLVGSVRINDFHADSVVVIPSSLIMRDAENREFVFIAQQEGDVLKAHKVIIESGRSYDGASIVLNGLAGTEMLVSQGARKLVDGQVIRTEEGSKTMAENAR
ncbi:MAG: efflux RND transporter periplasmic adaptor subunit [Flavobacteriales bacterium]|nr:efflux RND transporter periplasmic adaptor subunit [Flavobacteriales bacterium]